jgi:hypothetical protein
LNIEYMYISTYEFVHMLYFGFVFYSLIEMTPAHLQCSTIETIKLEK